jgi:hypothetical protein
MIADGVTSEEIHRKDRVNEDDLRIFRGRVELASDKSNSGMWIRSKNVGNHHLRSGGYFTTEPKWDKEDAELWKNYQENPYSKYPSKQARNFIRARYMLDKKTKKLRMDEKVKKFEKFLNEFQETTPAESSSNGSTKTLRDNCFNMAINKVKGVSESKKPSGGRVVGHGKDN